MDKRKHLLLNNVTGLLKTEDWQPGERREVVKAVLEAIVGTPIDAYVLAGIQRHVRGTREIPGGMKPGFIAADAENDADTCILVEGLHHHYCTNKAVQA